MFKVARRTLTTIKNMTHLLRDFLLKTKIFLIAIPLFYQYKLFKNNRCRTDKAILIQLKHNYFKRYLYVLIKFLYLEGYTIYIKPNFTGFYNLRTEQFGSYLFSEKIIRVCKPPKKH